LLFVDSDDWLEPEILQKARETGERTGAELVMFAFRSVDELGKQIQVFREELPKDMPLTVTEHREIYLTAPCAWNKLYRAALFRESAVRYPPRVWYEDIRTTLKLFLAAKTAVFLDDIGYNYLLREGSITKNLNADRNVEILEAFDDILSYFKAQGMFQEYREELCYLTLYHAYLTASVRVLRIDRKHPLLPRFAEYLEHEFPDWRKNRYLDRLGRNRKLLLFLLQRKWYFLIALLFQLKG
ncbi:MAG: hypothetical protein ACLRNW_00535, partial [Neglectibacter sp.]